MSRCGRSHRTRQNLISDCQGRVSSRKLELAETAPGQEHRGLNIPAEMARREERLKKIAEAKAAIERRARERYKRERDE